MKARILLASLWMMAGLVGCGSSGKQFLYTAGPGTPEIFQFRMNQNGALTPLIPANSAAGTSPVSVLIHPAGGFAYIANFAGSTVTLLSVNRGNGQLSVPVPVTAIPPSPSAPSNVFNTQAGPVAMAITPNGSFLYVLNQTAGNITAFTIDPTTGNLTVITPPKIGSTQPPPFFGNLTAPSSIATSTDGTTLFVASPSQHSITTFAIGSMGLLTQPNPPVVLAPSVTPAFVMTEPTGHFLYAADSTGNAVLGFSIGSGGSLTPLNGSPFPVGSQPVAIAATPNGTLLFVANQGSNNVSAFVIDSRTGGLGAVSGSPFPSGGKGPTYLAATGAFVYVTDAVTNDVASLAIGANGNLTPVAGSPFSVATQPVWVAFGNE
jgi:6-phosphogluconolactonase (cycloisomerase 2 family)